jgi:Flp pilus assembly pilin Flp
MATMLRRLMRDDDGQDLIEYALLSAAIGLAGMVAWAAISTSIGTAYQTWNTDVQNISACTPDPGGGGC